jgi:hypothetical protein
MHKRPATAAARLTSGWLVNYIREHGGAMTITRGWVVD